jgi:hypothetical protein
MYKFSRASSQGGYRSNHAISNDVIAHYAPSVLAESAHESRGERYSFIPTINVLDGLRAQGFQPFEVRQTRCRDLAKREFTKHLVRLRHPDAIGSAEEVPELVLVNSHDGTSSYQLLAGFFRMVCSNGLIAGNVCNDVRIRHSGNVIDDVIEGSFRVLENVKEIGARIEQYKSIELSRQEATVFANCALRLRWDEGKAPVSADQVLSANRYQDVKPDLWTTFNRAQENLIKGGLGGRGATGRRMTTRAVGGVTENVKLNRALWTLADGLAQLKSNAVTIDEAEELALI